MVATTPVPEAPRWVVGVVNLRGTLVPMIDLRRRLGLVPAEPDPSHVFLVATTRGQLVGIIADRVKEVVTATDAAIEQPGETLRSQGAVTGLSQTGDGAVLVLDLDRLASGATEGDGLRTTELTA